MSSDNEMLIKASGAIAVSHKLTLIQQKIWNALLHKAYPDLGKQDVYKISEKDILAHFPYETRNTEHLKECLDAITLTKVTFNILGKDKSNHWGVFTMMAQAELKNGVCTFAYAPILRDLLNNPAIYSKINILIQQRFSSRYTLFLYELCLDYIGVHQTPWIELLKFREIMGVEDHEYPRYNNLSLKIIQPAIKEINSKSDIWIKFEPKRANRKISHVKFYVEKNALSVKEEQPFDTDIYMKLTYLGFTNDAADKLVLKYPKETLLKAMEAVILKGKSITNKVGYFKKCLKSAA